MYQTAVKGRKGEAGPGRESLRSGCRSDKDVTNPRGIWEQRLSVPKQIGKGRFLGGSGGALKDHAFTILSHWLVQPGGVWPWPWLRSRGGCQWVTAEGCPLITLHPAQRQVLSWREITSRPAIMSSMNCECFTDKMQETSSAYQCQKIRGSIFLKYILGNLLFLKVFI